MSALRSTGAAGVALGDGAVACPRTAGRPRPRSAGVPGVRAAWRPSVQPERNSAPPARTAISATATMATPPRRRGRCDGPGGGHGGDAGGRDRRVRCGRGLGRAAAPGVGRAPARARGGARLGCRGRRFGGHAQVSIGAGAAPGAGRQRTAGPPIRASDAPAAPAYRIRYVRTETHDPSTPSPRPVASTITAVSRPSVTRAGAAAR